MIANLKPGLVRAAVYTRVSTDEQAAGAFSSLDYQYESAAAYIASHASEGWVLIGTRYDDAGYSGGNTDRPALDRLLHDIAADKVDAIVVYRLDRFVRSIFDFANIIRHLEKHHCAFISISEQFDTSTPQGKLHLNMMLSFSEFERELIAARTRDKAIAALQNGRWIGGPPPLGYDISPNGNGLKVNKAEAKRVNAIFEMYLKLGSLAEVLVELQKRRWHTKSWKKKNGDLHEGTRFQKGTLKRILSDPRYIGMVKCKGQCYEGVHEPIVARELWDRVQQMLKANSRNGGGRAKNRHGALLKGVLRCASCGTAMRHTFTKTNGRMYHYYRCDGSLKHGSVPCSTRSIPAAEIERVIVERIHAIGKDRELVKETISAAKGQIDRDLKLILAEIKTAELELSQLRREEKKVLPVIGKGGTAAERATERLEKIAKASVALQERLANLNRQAAVLRAQIIKPRDLKAALATFSEVWDALLSQERSRVIQLLVQQIDFDGEKETLSISFSPIGAKLLAAETATDSEGAK